MTVPSQTNRAGPYNGNDVTTAFDFDFRILDEDHIQVILANVNGDETVQTLTTDYTVTGVGAIGGGQVIMIVPPETGETLTIIRNVPFTQETDLENQGAYYAETIEAALDAAVMRDQQMQEVLSRTVKLNVSQDVSDLDTFTAAILSLAGRLLLPRANDALTRDDGTPLQPGDLYYNTVTQTLRYFNGSVWLDIADQAIAMTAESFVGDGVEDEFTLDRAPAVASNVLVWLGGVRQVPLVDYTIVGSTLLMDAPPGNGVALDTLIVATVATLNAPAEGSVVADSISDDPVEQDAILAKIGGVAPSDLGNSASRNVGTTTGTVAAGDDSRITGALQAAVEDQTISGGARVTSKALGTAGVVSSGTVTPDPGDRPMQHYTNGGAHTLAPGSNKGYYLLEITNNGSAGAISTGGWTKVTGSFTTTNGHKFLCSCIVSENYSWLTITPGQ